MFRTGRPPVFSRDLVIDLAALRGASRALPKRAASLDELDPIYQQLLDRPITQTLGHHRPRRAAEPDADVVRL